MSKDGPSSADREAALRGMIQIGPGSGEPQAVMSRVRGPKRAPFFSNWTVAVVFGLGAAALAGAFLLVAGIAAPWSVFGEYSPLAFVHDRRAADLLAASPTRANLAAADAESWTALSQAPADDVAWLHLLQADIARHGRLSPAGMTRLQRSYDVAPFGPDVSLWRIEFAFQNWDVLTPDLRKQVLDEVDTEAVSHINELSETPARVTNPAGRFALSLKISLLKTELRTAAASGSPRPRQAR